MDIQPSGPLNEYYQFEAKEQATYILFNDEVDVVFSEITAEDDTQFKQYLTQIIDSKILNGELLFESFVITEIEMDKALARLYNDDEVEWGKAKLSYKKSDL